MAWQLKAVGDFLLELFFPARCVGCGTEGSFLCPACKDALPKIEPPFCHRCGLPLAPGASYSHCASMEWAVDGIRSPFLFQGTVREAIHAVKYRGVTGLLPTLGELLADFLTSHALAADAIVPVPLHPRRLRERGYDQALLLAQNLGQGLAIPLATNVLIRHRHTPSQARSKGVAERHRNVEGAFQAAPGRLQGQAIILVDDVCTTGATLNACASALKAAGAQKVWGVTLAREA